MAAAAASAAVSRYSSDKVIYSLIELIKSEGTVVFSTPDGLFHDSIECVRLTADGKCMAIYGDGQSCHNKFIGTYTINESNHPFSVFPSISFNLIDEISPKNRREPLIFTIEYQLFKHSRCICINRKDWEEPEPPTATEEEILMDKDSIPLCFQTEYVIHFNGTPFGFIPSSIELCKTCFEKQLSSDYRFDSFDDMYYPTIFGTYIHTAINSIYYYVKHENED